MVKITGSLSAFFTLMTITHRRRHLDSSRINWRQYYYVRPLRHDQAHSWLFRLQELRLTNVLTYLLTPMLMHIWLTTAIRRGLELYECLLIQHSAFIYKKARRLWSPRPHSSAHLQHLTVCVLFWCVCVFEFLLLPCLSKDMMMMMMMMMMMSDALTLYTFRLATVFYCCIYF